jgi:hypothetical protein
MRPPRLTHALLATALLLLTLNLGVALTNGPGPSAGFVQTAHAQGAVNAGAQREQIIAQLKSLNSKLDAMRSRLDAPLTVRVDGGVDSDDGD